MSGSSAGNRQRRTADGDGNTMEMIKNILGGDLNALRKYRLMLSFFNDYRRDPLHFLNTADRHRRGFTVSDWEIMGLTKETCGRYLSSKDYYRMHPINGNYSSIIDDKLVLKYALYGTGLNGYMPEYYYLLNESGRPVSIMDEDHDGRTVRYQEVISLLKEKNDLALKPVKGSVGKGFCHLACEGGETFINGKIASEKEIKEYLHSCRNYIVSEYLRPHPYLARRWPGTANTIRYLSGRVGAEWRMLKSYIRFGSAKSGETDNFSGGGILSYIDRDGRFRGGYLLRSFHGRPAATLYERHPDTGEKLEGTIPCWTELVHAAEDIQRYLPQTKYLGFDFVITKDSKVKLLEINSLTTLHAFQLDRSILETDNGRWFFSSLNT